jgi:hypothetical protein
MLVALPLTRQYQLRTNLFVAAENLQNSKKRKTPVLESKKAGVFILNASGNLSFAGLSIWKGVIP